MDKGNLDTKKIKDCFNMIFKLKYKLLLLFNIP